MSFDSIVQSLVVNFIGMMTSGVILLLAYRMLLVRDFMQRHLGLLRFCMAFLFMCSYAYGIQVVNGASSDMEHLGQDNGVLRMDVYEKNESDCFKAWSRDLSHLSEVPPASLVPCVAFLYREAEKNKNQNEFRSAMPTSLFSNLLAFFGAFHGGLAAAFLYAWATTPRPPKKEEKES